jgi:hypothetical protein
MTGGGTDDIKALREFVEQYIANHAKEHELLGMALVLAREVSEKDLMRTSTALEKRLEGMNEFRAQLTDAQATYATRGDMKALGDKYDAKIDGINRLVYMAVGVVLFIGMFSGLIIYFIRKG